MVLTVHDVTKSFPGAEGDVPVLRGVSLSLERGETLALTGESGSGKSTLLHLIGGLDRVDSGSITVAGREITTMSDTDRAALRRSDVGVIFQQFNLIPSLTVEANIAFQARLAGAFDADHAARLSKALGLTEHLAKYPEALSGGQQQRVAIARTLTARPKLVLADEPTGNLDEATASEVLGQMLRLVRETGAALLMVTHSSSVARRMERHVNLSQGHVV
ncbi:MULTISPECIES: ABC transporter ATP-binding protein [Marivita]|uniref:ABC transporter ATP-binding protein n=1 Tax=Marivita cryptomonadis TaxID=505252 RepID=A0A9Q2P0F6_9RHOB|nr:MULTISPECIES: ABC transporter ATP-binding protein [Marivita]MCR9167698.1 ABC transporter ATP-binding protein [Paracoccaceae bacterium]MBM2322103.1 ABC transporter ATP-binding protein [Marivita cryptomonadis]MBM2331684.1 ABC transporter ATP-binding protein [Marivita cryptomonadis]MBM2341269.1 ABC transporter ATP-binding protein [Marivita cryptomonadis]MBM2345932.1 ABC transporter ATP-binding protein [Marivita cryptomonadis]